MDGLVRRSLSRIGQSVVSRHPELEFDYDPQYPDVGV